MCFALSLSGFSSLDHFSATSGLRNLMVFVTLSFGASEAMHWTSQRMHACTLVPAMICWVCKQSRRQDYAHLHLAAARATTVILQPPRYRCLPLVVGALAALPPMRQLRVKWNRSALHQVFHGVVLRRKAGVAPPKTRNSKIRRHR